jgi:hypothetical protein
MQCTVSPRALQPAKHLNNNAITRTDKRPQHKTAGAGSAFRAITKILQWRELQSIAESTPNTADSPLTILEKLAKLKKDTLFEQVYFTGGNPADRSLVLEPWSSNELWLVPPAELRGINRRNYVGLDETDGGSWPRLALLSGSARV